MLTSNRDEAPNRVSLPPDFYTIDGANMLFPKDKIAGGTWIGLSENNRLICLLNGGFVKHERVPNYRLSRGVIVKDLLASNKIVEAVSAIQLENIEPFTLVIADWNSSLKFFELVWDGFQKHFKELPLEPKIWSSSTLYSETMKKERQLWFESYKDKNQMSSESILNFHQTAGEDTLDYGVVMDRGFVKTTSITQVEKSNDSLQMTYKNLQTNEIVVKEYHLPQVIND